MSTTDDELMSLEELERLMDEQEMNNTMATPASASTTIAPSTITTIATATTSENVSEASNERISDATLLKELYKDQQTPTLPANTSGAKMSKRSGIQARKRKAKSVQKLSKIPVYITENREAHQIYSMERVPWTDQRDKEHNSAYFDDATLAKQAVPLSFDESEGSGAISPPAAGMANALNALPTKPAVLYSTSEQPNAKPFAPTTLGRGKSTSSSHFPAQLGKSNSATTRVPGGPREVITISFPTTGALSSILKDLNTAKETRADGMVISINGPIGENQVEVSGPMGSNIRGFVKKTCPLLGEKQIKAAFKSGDLITGIDSLGPTIISFELLNQIKRI
ncbi:hypothetical protein BGAL_0213g00150 [Botrytis galanthina]|uniref:Uncharacterized protein n=1 Tax=Botrytis galanthina TaxID=278940 RepID=A0A4S8R4J2_9HELO|nr:hypothetical protein BGAL_0213g00150 [Botrytis galanthina]